MLATWRSSGVAAWSTSTKPWNKVHRLSLLFGNSFYTLFFIERCNLIQCNSSSISNLIFIKFVWKQNFLEILVENGDKVLLGLVLRNHQDKNAKAAFIDTATKYRTHKNNTSFTFVGTTLAERHSAYNSVATYWVRGKVEAIHLAVISPMKTVHSKQ